MIVGVQQQPENTLALISVLRSLTLGMLESGGTPQRQVLAWAMPSGRVHNAINTLTLVAIAGGYGYAVQQDLVPIMPPTNLAAFSVAFLAGTFLLSPDLDLAENNVSSKSNWGWLGFLWVPYGWMFSHRGMSHTWIVGPLTRVLYLMLLLAVPVYLLHFPLERLRVNLDQNTLLAAIIGYYVSQWLHLIADGVSPDIQPRFSRSRRRY